ERLQFADQSIVLGGLNHEPDNPLALSGEVAEGVPVTVSIANVIDLDNPRTHHITGPVSYFWQIENEMVPGQFDDITVFAAREFKRIEGTTFTPTPDLVGVALRVRAVYIDGNGVLEEVFSAPQVVGVHNDPPTGAPTISDTTPTEGTAITALTDAISDPD